MLVRKVTCLHYCRQVPRTIPRVTARTAAMECHKVTPPTLNIPLVTPAAILPPRNTANTVSTAVFAKRNASCTTPTAGPWPAHVKTTSIRKRARCLRLGGLFNNSKQHKRPVPSDSKQTRRQQNKKRDATQSNATQRNARYGYRCGYKSTTIDRRLLQE